MCDVLVKKANFYRFDVCGNITFNLRKVLLLFLAGAYIWCNYRIMSIFTGQTKIKLDINK